MSPSLSLIFPAFNESGRLGKTLRTTFDYLNAQDYAAEVIVVDDGSSDDTPHVAEAAFAGRGRTEARLLRYEPNRGKGHAVRRGLLDARAPVALFSDSDLSTPITETPKLFGPIRSGEYDIVFGSRALDRTLIGVHQPWLREQSGKVFNLAVRLATRLPYYDTQCGFKAFRMDVCRPVVEGSLIDRFGFDVELLYVAHMAGLRLLEQPVRWDDAAGSKVSFRSGLQGFFELRELRRQAKRGVYDEAVRRTRELSRRPDTRAPLLAAGEPAPPSDASPELAGRRI
ncbi:MAG TPA: dolichyl-phosphate beta-glucosyltransferase [Pyrinomonadaceae bacterium]|nr:dolichyl-phosphate beta-glucosyltransferase [Pyrinomonadaceae bacterium]